MPMYIFMDDNIKIMANNIVEIKMLFILFNFKENCYTSLCVPSKTKKTIFAELYGTKGFVCSRKDFHYDMKEH
jgi:hypothetical protein